jgi:multiple sugar transport system substrate-binding protein
VTKAVQERPFWTADPHRKSVHDQYASGTVTFEFTKNWNGEKNAEENTLRSQRVSARIIKPSCPV